MRLAGASTLLLLQWSQRANSTEVRLHRLGDITATAPLPGATGQVGPSRLPIYAVELVVDMEKLTLDALNSHDLAFGDTEFATYMDQLIETKHQLNLFALEATLKKGRVLAGEDPTLLDTYYSKASILVKNCLAPETIMERAFDTDCHEILRCLSRHPIWDSKEQHHWFWAKIYGTPAFDKTIWDQQEFEYSKFRNAIFKADNPEFYETMYSTLSLNEQELCQYIIQSDSANILTRFHPEIAKSIDLMIEYSATRILNQTIPPHTVKSAHDLQNIFRAGYKRIPKFCLLLKNNVPTIHPECAEWLVENNCLALLKELAQTHPNSIRIDYCKSGIITKSLDMVKWLLNNMSVQPPLDYLMTTALNSGNLEIIEWLYDDYKNQIDWNAAFCRYTYYPKIALHDSIINFLKTKSGLTPPLTMNLKLFFLAAEDDLEGLKAMPPKTLSEWKQTASVAALRRNKDILNWIHNISKSLPPSWTVEAACKSGDYSVLHWIYETSPSLITTHRVMFGYISAPLCLFYATIQNNQDEMEWILNNLLKNQKLTLFDFYHLPMELTPEEPLLRIFGRIATDKTKLSPGLLDEVIIGNHAQVFRQLCGKGLAITEFIVTRAVSLDRIEIVKMIYALNPLLLCSKMVADEAKSSSRVWKCDILDLIEKTCSSPTLSINQ